MVLIPVGISFPLDILQEECIFSPDPNKKDGKTFCSLKGEGIVPIKDVTCLVIKLTAHCQKGQRVL
jgi:hypothetical protein